MEVSKKLAVDSMALKVNWELLNLNCELELNTVTEIIKVTRILFITSLLLGKSQTF